jgi:hypothetical protein
MLGAIRARLQHGEQASDVRADLEVAAAVLAGERSDVRWTEVGADVLFSEMGLGYSQRLIRAVNLRAEACLDLAKIHNLQTDSEIVAPGTSGPPDDSNDNDEPTGDGASGGEGADPEKPKPGDGGGVQPGGDGPVGATRTSQWQELRDLKVELRRNPYFGLQDLPPPPAVTPK